MNHDHGIESISPNVVTEDLAAAGWSSKIKPQHREGLAFVYIRQSTPHQVLNHRESALRQYSLVDMAIQLGWPADRIEVVDEDQGQSGTTAENRNGFQRLLSEVSLDRVGMILGIELSRLARSNKDWHQLIELCAIFGTMLADQDGLYDPTNYNDRLLLGLRGIMNEAELHVLQGRMHQALLSKAKRGEVYQQMADFDRLRVRLTEMKSSGMSYSEIAAKLNCEGFQPANQTKCFNKAIVGRLAKRFCRHLTTSKNVSAPNLQQHEWTLKELARTLGIPRTTLHTWTQRGWLHVSRQLPGYRGTIICWADQQEMDRLRRLRAAQWHYGDPPLPKELTMPKLCNSN